MKLTKRILSVLMALIIATLFSMSALAENNGIPGNPPEGMPGGEPPGNSRNTSKYKRD